MNGNMYLHWIPSHIGRRGKRSISGNDIADMLANSAREKIPEKHAQLIFEECSEIAASLCMEIFRLSEISAHGPLHSKKCDDIVGLNDAIQEHPKTGELL